MGPIEVVSGVILDGSKPGTSFIRPPQFPQKVLCAGFFDAQRRHTASDGLCTSGVQHVPQNLFFMGFIELHPKQTIEEAALVIEVTFEPFRPASFEPSPYVESMDARGEPATPTAVEPAMPDFGSIDSLVESFNEASFEPFNEASFEPFNGASIESPLRFSRFRFRIATVEELAIIKSSSIFSVACFCRSEGSVILRVNHFEEESTCQITDVRVHPIQ